MPYHATSPYQARERKIMKLLLKVKNGTPPMRKQALRQITDKASHPTSCVPPYPHSHPSVPPA